jgi:hypothetical protein
MTLVSKTNVSKTITMVQKSKGGRKSQSVKKDKVLKGERKYHRKDNYKKKKDVIIECKICYELVTKSTDNSVLCGNVVHPICGPCKLKMDDKKCPMCRSHTIKTPKEVVQPLRIISKGGRFGKELTFQDLLYLITYDGHITEDEESRPRHLTK